MAINSYGWDSRLGRFLRWDEFAPIGDSPQSKNSGKVYHFARASNGGVFMTTESHLRDNDVGYWPVPDRPHKPKSMVDDIGETSQAAWDYWEALDEWQAWQAVKRAKRIRK